jgi:hypothetical protein
MSVTIIHVPIDKCDHPCWCCLQKENCTVYQNKTPYELIKKLQGASK